MTRIDAEFGLYRYKLPMAEWIAKLHNLPSNSFVRLEIKGEDPELLKIEGELMGQWLEKVQTIRRLRIENRSFSASATSAYLSELVSGLKRNPHPTIQELEFWWFHTFSDTIYISEIIRHTTKLQKLNLRSFDPRELSEDVAESLTSSIAEAVHLNLDELTFTGIACAERVSKLLRKIFPSETDSVRRYLRKLFLGEWSGSGWAVWNVSGWAVWWEMFPILMGSNISAISVEVSPGYAYSSELTAWWKEFANALKSSPVMSIDIDFNYYEPMYNDYTGIDIRVKAERHSTGSLRVIETGQSSGRTAAVATELLMSSDVRGGQIEFVKQLFADDLRSSSSITKLALSLKSKIFECWWEGVCHTLKSNTSVTSLDLSDCVLTDVHFEQLRSLLRVNFTIEEVKLERTSWRNDGKAALIEEALARNKKQATEFSTLRAAGFEFDKAKVGRVFLCGSPYAGKTQLKLRMMRLYHKRSKSPSKPGFFERLKMLELRRTKGAEVEVLMNNREEQISLWDLAGQYIFRALHDLIFPRTNQSLIFIFVFNPLREDSKKDMKQDVYDAFALELEEWLKFVASNCQTADSDHLPQILIVITHRDLTDMYPKRFECGPGSAVLKIVEGLQSTFQGVVKLVSTLYHINARAKKDVRTFSNNILALMKDWSKVHSVPVVCSDISSALLAHVKSSSSSPVLSQSIFYRLCQDHHEILRNANPEILFTIVSYLHDVGRIIIVPECSGSGNDGPLIIVDPNWCTEVFLETMIAVGNQFDVRGVRSSGSTVFTTSRDGFIDEQDFHLLLQQTLRQMRDEGTERTLLEKLLQRLNLCYRCEDGGFVKYFVPIICGGLEDLRRRQLQWDDEQTERSEYLGYRLQCKDTRTTSFNKGVFSRFQIKFRQELMELLGMDESNCGISCGLGVLRVKYDGYEVLVESDEVNGEHVDIMVKSSQQGVKNPRTRTTVISFLQECFLRKLQKFYASSSGCPGIILVMGVIRSSSVQKLVPVWERRTSQHSIALEELKKKFRLNIDLKLQAMGAEVDEESLLNFQYRWPDGGLELVKDTLGPEDLKDILSYVRGKVVTFEREVQICSNELHHMLTKLSGEGLAIIPTGESSFMRQNAEMEEEAGTSSGGPRHSVTGLGENFQISEDLKPLADFIGAKFDQFGMKLERKIDQLAHLMMAELQQLKAGMKEMQKAMTAVNSSIDKMIGYSLSREDHSCPRRPYFTKKDVGLLPKGKAYVLEGQAVRLHFLCESRNRPHVVQDQPGLPLVITEEEMNWVPFISRVSLKLISTLISVGIQLIAGVQINTRVLHFANLDTGELLPMSNELLEYMKRDSNIIRVDPADPHVMQSWSLFQKYLGEKLNYNTYRNIFGLCRVRYSESSDPYAWICEDCVEKGTKPLKILDELN